MKRFPYLLTGILVVIWLLLNGSVSAGHILLGTSLAVMLMLAAAQLRPVFPRVRRLHEAVILIFVVLTDIVRSNIGVGRIVLGLTGGRETHSGFVDIPLQMRDPHGLSILAAIVTATPGTAWAGLSEDGSVLTLHVLDLVDHEHWIKTIKQRYEAPLMRIFE